MKIFDIFRQKPAKSTDNKHRFDFHEDDFCRVEMRPKENLDELTEDLVQVDGIHKNHSSEFGYSKIHVIQEGKVKTVDRQIKVEDLERIVQQTRFKKFDRITTGFGSQVYDSQHSIGYGVKGCALLFEVNRNYVDHIWFDYYPTADKTENLDEIFEYIFEISKKWNLILVDWNQEVIVDSQNRQTLINYLKGEFEN
tara:strand:+ start:1142 stop:1729 length:588 start_codon:yes stop_codon:yes gene_type:complete